jgi:hypothetical protein
VKFNRKSNLDPCCIRHGDDEEMPKVVRLSLSGNDGLAWSQLHHSGIVESDIP